MLKDELSTRLARVLQALYALFLGAIGLILIVLFLTILIWPLALYITEQYISFFRLSAVVIAGVILQLPTIALLCSVKRKQSS